MFPSQSGTTSPSPSSPESTLSELVPLSPEQLPAEGQWYSTGLALSSAFPPRLPQWFVLNDISSGRLHLRLEWLSLIADPEALTDVSAGRWGSLAERGAAVCVEGWRELSPQSCSVFGPALHFRGHVPQSCLRAAPGLSRDGLSFSAIFKEARILKSSVLVPVSPDHREDPPLSDLDLLGSYWESQPEQS